MNIHYKIVSVQEQDHTIVVRYWTDLLTELMLANSDRVNADGSPERCRTDVALTLPIPEPDEETLDQIIRANAPVHSLTIMEAKLNPEVSFKMDVAKSLVGKAKTVSHEPPKPQKKITNEEIDDVINKMFKGKAPKK